MSNYNTYDQASKKSDEMLKKYNFLVDASQ